MNSGKSERAAILLAAGASARMGRPKALVEWGATTFLGSLLDAYLPFCEQVIVVLGAHAQLIRAGCGQLAQAEIALNPDPDLGQFSSLQIGLQLLGPSIRQVFFQPVDAPGIAPATLEALSGALADAPVAVPVNNGRHGHPVLLSRAVADEMLRLPATATARDVLRPHRDRTIWVEVPDPAVLRDFDTEQALRSGTA